MCGLIGSFHATCGGLVQEVERLAKINNRGHEAVGLVASDGYTLMPFRRHGYVRDACTDEVNQWRHYAGDVVHIGCDRFVGHVRYSTVGSSDIGLAQPMRMINPLFGEFFLAHNGQYPYHQKMREWLEAGGSRFHTDSDSEVLAAYLASLKVNSLAAAMAELIRHIEGSFSILALSKTELVAARDRFGIRPLWYDADDNDVFFASETGALPNGGRAREVMPGAVVVVTKNQGAVGIEVKQIMPPARLAYCVFEQLYFARPDQRIGAVDTAAVRRVLGRKLAMSCPAQADLVCAVPDSGTPSACGYAEQSKLPYEPAAIIRNYYSVRGRSFILPEADGRAAAARRKYSIAPATVCGRRVVVVDDTIVRATTMPVIVKMLFAAGAREVHVRIPAPPVVDICYLGIDIKSREELPATKWSVEELNRKIIKATSLQYLTVEELVDVCGAFHAGWCTGCFGGNYPIAWPAEGGERT